ncbi:hypothetical protein AZI86_09895 [Bdellovibrio bacteriovorus]|uniref:PLD phosphodiesterase domain-containing protein n=1 Tax=Bdellovibrio bacteriovorus TaxID=959 RepID=A0A150WSP4_BDEBC|nr:phospholipase D family protein [Bdellovibrio bacteriovorus]KYG67299.1 hypothetical protein AZI86_09895 [Bdellovibrio bacteriovorus]
MKIVVWSFLIFVLTGPSCQSIPKNFNATPSYHFLDTENTYWGKYFAKEIKSKKDQSGFHPLVAGTDALVARLESIRHAEKSLDVQYYIWHDDDTGKLMLSEIIKAADRGVRVRLLLDDLNIGKYQDSLLVIDSHPNIEVRMFNPFANRTWRIFEVFRFGEINRRMHNKSLIADNQTVIIGGRNIGNEYFTASSEANFGDFDVWCFGPVVKEASQSFDLYWNDRLAIPIAELYKRSLRPEDLSQLKEALNADAKSLAASEYQKSLNEAPLSVFLKTEKLKTFWGRGKIVSDSPAKIRGDENAGPPLNQVTGLPIKSQKEIFIVSPYFIPGKNGVDYFAKKVKAGVQVDVFTNSLASNDVGLVFAGYKKYRKGLIKAGVRLYEMKPKVRIPQGSKSRMGITSAGRLGLHGKVYIFDRRVMFVGSMNLDPRSVDLNSELGVLIESPELADLFVTNLKREMSELAYRVTLDEKNKLRWETREDDQDVVLTSEPEASGWKTFTSGFLGLFVPESLL